MFRVRLHSDMGGASRWNRRSSSEPVSMVPNAPQPPACEYEGVCLGERRHAQHDTLVGDELTHGARLQPAYLAEQVRGEIAVFRAQLDVAVAFVAHVAAGIVRKVRCP